MSNISFSKLLSLFGRFDLYVRNKSPFWYWNTLTRTSLSCSKFPSDAKLRGESKVAWALCALAARYVPGCVRAAAGFAFCWSVRSRSIPGFRLYAAVKRSWKQLWSWFCKNRYKTILKSIWIINTGLPIPKTDLSIWTLISNTDAIPKTDLSWRYTVCCVSIHSQLSEYKYWNYSALCFQNQYLGLTQSQILT